MAKRHFSKRELEELKKKEEEQAAAQVFEQFVATFQEEPSKIGKVWVKAGTYDAGQRKEDTQEKGKLYRPVSKIPELAETKHHIKEEKNDLKLKKKEKDKKKSNLELFKEELKAAQLEREERHRVKNMMNVPSTKTSRFEPAPAAATGKVASSSLIITDEKTGSFDSGDPNTTNLYLGNINPKITEQQLMEIFGKYGPLASVKIMWPRSEEEKARNRNCGFVAFMSRKDAERAMKKLLGKDIMGFEMKMGWGKALPIPARPIYIPPALVKTTLPPPPTGLPFNAVPEEADADKISSGQRENDEDFNEILSRAVVKVVIPTERNLLCLIHRMVEFVVREGPMFEAMMMNREIDNPQFRFLFENRSPAHVYYRWKLFSVLQGDAVNKWRTEDFRMFKGGSIWRPPPVNPFAQGMPDEMFSSDEEDEEDRRKSLSKSQKKRLEHMLRDLTPERSKIIDAMIFCIEHAEAADEVIDFITESLSSSRTPLIKKLGRFYLVTDVLYNSSAKAVNASNYRTGFQSRLHEIVKYMNRAYEKIESRLKAEAFKQRVMQCFRALEDWAMYPQDFLIQLQNIFLGLVTEEKPKLEQGGEDVDGVPLEDPDLDGAPLSDSEDLDGVPLDGAALLRGASKLQSSVSQTSVSSLSKTKKPIPSKKFEEDDDIDGVPLGASEGYGTNTLEKSAPKITSKWETAEEVGTSSKWESDKIFPDARRGRPDREDASTDPETSRAASSYVDEDIDGAPLDDSSQDASQRSWESKEADSNRHEKLRKIELEVLRYQDELESGVRCRVSYLTMPEQVERYRQELLRNVTKGKSREEREPESSRSRRDSEKEYSRHKVKGRRGSRSRSRSRSSSRRRRSRSRSVSPKRSKRTRSRSTSPKRSKRSRSRSASPKRSRRSRSRSRSRSPSRKSRSSKKSRR